MSKSASIALPATPAVRKAAHFRPEERRCHAQLPLTVGKATVRGIASACLEELAAHASALQVRSLSNLSGTMCILAFFTLATFIGKKELAHLCLHELANMLLS
jgi:hypothetical protein